MRRKKLEKLFAINLKETARNVEDSIEEILPAVIFSASTGARICTNNVTERLNWESVTTPLWWAVSQKATLHSC